MSEKNVTAARGYYLCMNQVMCLLIDLFRDTQARQKGIVVLVGEEKGKLDGAILALMALQEAFIRMKIYGDLIPLTEPNLKEMKDAANIVGENNKPLQEKTGPV